MFNIVKRRDFMLGRNVATKEEAEQAARDYGSDYVAVKADLGETLRDLPNLHFTGSHKRRTR